MGTYIEFSILHGKIESANRLAVYDAPFGSEVRILLSTKPFVISYATPDLEFRSPVVRLARSIPSLVNTHFSCFKPRNRL